MTFFGLGHRGIGVNRVCGVAGRCGLNVEGIDWKELNVEFNASDNTMDVNDNLSSDVINKPLKLDDCSRFKKLCKVDLNDRNIYEYDSSEVRATKQEMKWRLIGGVLGNGISMAEMIEFSKHNWKDICVDISVRNNGIWVFDFRKEYDLMAILQHDTWLVKGRFPLALTRWKVGVKYSWASFEYVPAWVRLWNLDEKFKTSRMLNVIGSMIGDPLIVDNSYWARSKPQFVRMLVSVCAKDIQKEALVLRNKDGNEYSQKVWFEWVPHICEHCCSFGHLTKGCKQIVPEISSGLCKVLVQTAKAGLNVASSSMRVGVVPSCGNDSTDVCVGQHSLVDELVSQDVNAVPGVYPEPSVLGSKGNVLMDPSSICYMGKLLKKSAPVGEVSQSNIAVSMSSKGTKQLKISSGKHVEEKKQIGALTRSSALKMKGVKGVNG